MQRMLALFLILAIITGFAYWRIRLGHDPGLLEASANVNVESRSEPGRDTSANRQASPLLVPKIIFHASQTSDSVESRTMTVSSCHVLSAAEIEVASQVDGTLHEIHVHPGQQVRAGDSLGKLDDRQLLPQIELLKIRARSLTSERIARTQYEEAIAKYEAGKEANRAGVNVIPALELQSFALQVKRFEQEILKAQEDRKAAEKELEKAMVLWEYHKLVSGLEGEVVKVFKRKGETVRQAESLFRVADHHRLSIEGLCRTSQVARLRLGMKAIVEPELRADASNQLSGHTAPITSLAVSADGRYLASGSEDRTVMLWSLPSGRRIGVIPVPSEVTCVALASGGELGAHVLVASSTDGYLRSWTIPKEGKISDASVFPKMHDGPIRTLAVRSDGRRAISGGDDRRVAEWDLAEKKHLRWVRSENDASAHGGAVTSVAFASADCLVSAARDHRIRVWKLDTPENPLIADHPGRTGEVHAFNAHPHGKFVLFDHGDELRVLDTQNGTVASDLRLRKQGHFQNFAYFSPRGTFVVTNQSTGRMQVWKGLSSGGNEAEKRQDGQELCHYPVANHTVTCGSFAPDETVFYSAGTDHLIRAWPLPTENQWREPLTGTLAYIANQLERGTDTVRIRVDVENPAEPERRLRAGMLANLRFVLPPSEKASR